MESSSGSTHATVDENPANLSPVHAAQTNCAKKFPFGACDHGGKPVGGAGCGRWRLGKPVLASLACAPTATAPGQLSHVAGQERWSFKLRRRQPGVDACMLCTGDTADLPLKFLVVMLQPQPRPDGQEHQEPLAEDPLYWLDLEPGSHRPCGTSAVSDFQVISPFCWSATPQRSLPKRKVGCTGWTRMHE